MHLLFTFFTLLCPTFAHPSSNTNSPSAMISRFIQSDDCKLPQAPTTCSGAAQKDVIVHYGKNITQEEKDLFLDAAKASGATIKEVMNNFGFTGLIPEKVVSLMAAHGATCGLTIYENGCAGIPWCGEAPC